MTNPWFLMLAMQLWQQIERLPVKPPVTLAVMGASAALHFGFLNLPTGTYTAEMPERGGDRRWTPIGSSPPSYPTEIRCTSYITCRRSCGRVPTSNQDGQRKFTKLLLGLLVCTNAMAVGVMYAMAAYLGMPEAIATPVSWETTESTSRQDDPLRRRGVEHVHAGNRDAEKWASWAELGAMYLMYPHTAGLAVHVCVSVGWRTFAGGRSCERSVWRTGSRPAARAVPVEGGGGGGNYARNEQGREPRRTEPEPRLLEARRAAESAGSSAEGPTPARISSPARGSPSPGSTLRP